MQNVFLKVGVSEEARGGDKGDENDSVNNSERHHICVGTRQWNALKTVGQDEVGGVIEGV
jgi:hypothetical protein